MSDGFFIGGHNAPENGKRFSIVDAEDGHESKRPDILPNGVLPCIPEGGTTVSDMLSTVSQKGCRTPLCTAIHPASLYSQRRLMITYLYYVCAKKQMSSRTLFQVAYKKQFGVDGDIDAEYNKYLKTYTLPQYVIMYLEDIRDREVYL